MNSNTDAERSSGRGQTPGAQHTTSTAANRTVFEDRDGRELTLFRVVDGAALPFIGYTESTISWGNSPTQTATHAGHVGIDVTAGVPHAQYYPRQETTVEGTPLAVSLTARVLDPQEAGYPDAPFVVRLVADEPVATTHGSDLPTAFDLVYWSLADAIATDGGLDRDAEFVPRDEQATDDDVREAVEAAERDGAWRPEPVSLREGETPDVSAHASRTLVQLEQGIQDGFLEPEDLSTEQREQLGLDGDTAADVDTEDPTEELPLVTDGGSKYVVPTGDGFESVLRITDRSAEINPGSIDAVDWSAGTFVYFVADPDGVQATASEPPQERRLGKVARVYSARGSGSGRLTIPDRAIDYLGVPDGDDIRVYVHDDDGLLLVAKDDDPRVMTDGGETRCVECGAFIPDEIGDADCPQCGAGQLVTDGGQDIVAVVALEKPDTDDEQVVAHGMDYETVEAWDLSAYVIDRDSAHWHDGLDGLAPGEIVPLGADSYDAVAPDASTGAGADSGADENREEDAEVVTDGGRDVGSRFALLLDELAAAKPILGDRVPEARSYLAPRTTGVRSDGGAITTVDGDREGGGDGSDSAETVTDVDPRPLAAGDEVYDRDHDRYGEVREVVDDAIVGGGRTVDRLRIRWDGGEDEWFHRSWLQADAGREIVRVERRAQAGSDEQTEVTLDVNE